ncbi:MAG: type II toxin-antitoxin system HicB family antitoxin [Elusimicrobiota bacterium]
MGKKTKAKYVKEAHSEYIPNRFANYTIVIVKSENWYAGYVKELPGAHSQGKTIDEVKENLKESIKMILESNYRHFISGQNKVLEERITVNV